MEKRQFTLDLVCKLSGDEVAQHAAKAAEAAEKRAACDETIETHREAAKVAKEQGEGHGRDVARHLRCVRSGQESRQVDCVEEYDEESDKMLTTRTDTGESVSTRPVLEHERQGNLRMLPHETTAEEQDVEDRTPAGA